MVIGNVIEKMNFVLLEHQRGSNAVDWSIPPAFVEEAASPVQMAKVVDVLFRSQPIKVSNLEVGPLKLWLARKNVLDMVL
jgi:hypothetical protein